MTREEAKEIVLKWCKDGIDKYGEDAIYAASPQPGKMLGLGKKHSIRY